MENTKVQIKKIGKRLNIVCVLAIIASIFGTVVLIGISVASLVNETAANDFMANEDKTGLIEMIEEWRAENKNVNVRYAAAIAAFLQAIPYALTAVLLFIVRKMLLTIVNGETPFTLPVAKSLRRCAYVSLILIFRDPLVAFVIFLILLFFSALFEYGAVIQAKADQTSRIQEEMIVSFAEITENKSSQTGNHVKRVSEYSRILAKQMGLSEEECEKLRLASTMHDIGKLQISTKILEKPARLTDEEFAEIKKHSSYGGELLDSVEGEIMEMARTIALDHHERPDGRGYPAGKRGDEISMEGRIVAVADVYDALTSKRSYKDPWPSKVAYEEIVKNAGSQFDEKVVEAFKAAYPEIEKTRESYADTARLTFKPTEDKKTGKDVC